MSNDCACVKQLVELWRTHYGAYKALVRLEAHNKQYCTRQHICAANDSQIMYSECVPITPSSGSDIPFEQPLRQKAHVTTT
jgi:hypothetical protein